MVSGFRFELAFDVSGDTAKRLPQPLRPGVKGIQVRLDVDEPDSDWVRDGHVQFGFMIEDLSFENPECSVGKARCVSWIPGLEPYVIAGADCTLWAGNDVGTGRIVSVAGETLDDGRVW